MPANQDTKVSLQEATRLLFRTKQPTETQIRRVIARMRTRSIPADTSSADPKQWTTTVGDIANFLARLKAEKGAAGDDDAGESGRYGKAMKTTYRDLFRDYFLAVMLRRDSHSRGQAFHHAVLAGRVGGLLLIVGLFVVAWFISQPAILPEQVAVEAWISERWEKYEITNWGEAQPAPNGEGQLIDVWFRYKPRRGPMVQTQRTFRIVGDKAIDQGVDD